MSEKISRRNVVKAALVAGAASVAGEGKSAMAVKAKTEAPATEATDPNPITTEDIAAFDRITGREYTGPEREQMARSLAGKRKALLAVRTSDLAAEAAPAFRFDPRVPGMMLPDSKDSIALSRGKAPVYKNGDDLERLAFCTVAELARLLKDRKVTSVALTQMYLGRLKQYGPRLLCVVSLLETSALEQARNADAEIAVGNWRGPLHGIPYAVKDLLAAKNTHTTFGAKPFEKQMWDFDSTVVARLEAAGAVLCAKLSMGELAMGDVWFGGTTRNPWKPETGSSGSSAGSASATAAGLVGFTIGTETLGSITSPSRVCGTTGLRPTFGRVSRHGAMPLSWTMDKIGPICRGVEDCALVFSAIHGADDLDPTAESGIGFRWNPRSSLKELRVGLDVRSFDAVRKGQDGEARIAPYAAALDVLRSLGIEPKPVTLPAPNDAYNALTGLIISVEGAASFAPLMTSGGLGDLVQQDDWNWPNSFRVASTVPAADYIQAMRVRSHLQRAMADTLKDIDVYITIPFSGPSITWTNLCGQPTVITRAGQTLEGLPISIEFTGNLFREDAALRLAWAFEQVTQWHTQWPDVSRLPETPPTLVREG